MRESAFLVLLLTACAPAGPAEVRTPPDSAAGEVPISLEGPNDAALVVAVSLNGSEPFDFVLDTGATLTCVDQVLADRLDLPEARGVRGRGAGVMGNSGAGGVRVVTLDSIRVGAAVAEGLNACVVDLEHIRSLGIDVHGLLGLNFISEFRMSLDFQRNVLVLRGYDGEAAP